MDLGEKIRQHRKAMGFSQKQLGAILDVSHDIVSLWELNKLVPDLNMFKKICVLFDIMADEMLEIETEEQRHKVLGVNWVLKA